MNPGAPPRGQPTRAGQPIGVAFVLVGDVDARCADVRARKRPGVVAASPPEICPTTLPINSPSRFGFCMPNERREGDGRVVADQHVHVVAEYRLPMNPDAAASRGLPHHLGHERDIALLNQRLPAPRVPREMSVQSARLVKVA